VGEFFELQAELQAEQSDFDPIKSFGDNGFAVEPYGKVYELPVAHIATYLFCELGLWTQVVKASKSNDPQAKMLELAYTDIPDTAFSWELIQQTLGSITVLLKNIECVSLFNLWMPELLDQVSEGNDGALFQAVLIDACVLETYACSKRIALASLANDRSFFDRLSKAITKTKPTRPVARLDNTRLAMEVLHEAGKLENMTDSELTDWIIHLGLYPIRGDALQAIRRQRQNRDSARNHLKVDSGDSHSETEMP
jgi:hypothetical protein